MISMNPSPSRSATTGLASATSMTLGSSERGPLPGLGVGSTVQSKPLPLQRVRSRLRMNGIW